jgi:transposase
MAGYSKGAHSRTVRHHDAFGRTTQLKYSHSLLSVPQMQSNLHTIIYHFTTNANHQSDHDTKNHGIIKGFHRKMKLIQRRAYGFKNFENYRLRVILECVSK